MVMRNMYRIRSLFSAVVVIGICAAVSAEEAVKTGHTVIRSKRLTYDYRRSIAIFEEDVVVRDPAVRIESDRLNVLMAGTNAVRSVTATGNVRFWHEDKEGRCDKAIYISRTGEVLLYGNAEIIRGPDRVSGTEIEFNIYRDKITCTPATLVIFSADGGPAELGIDLGSKRAGSSGADRN